MMRTSDTDTIVAIATAPGEGAIGIVRLSGPEAISIANACFEGARSLFHVEPRKLIFGRFVHNGQDLDEVLASVMYGPNSFTGEDTVEFNCHGGPYLLKTALEALVFSGARLALPGEFTKRAFLNNKIDLSQAQAVADMISAPTDLSLRSAYFQLRGGLRKRYLGLADDLRQVAMLLEAGLDFSEDVEIDLRSVRRVLDKTVPKMGALVESYQQGKVIRGGALIALVGKPNVGKSSLMNRLLEEDRAIVTNIPGTTRDTIEEQLDLDGLLAKLVDTAGIRETDDPVEREGTKRSKQTIARSHLVLYVVDGAASVGDDDRLILEQFDPSTSLLVFNKSDLGRHNSWSEFQTLPHAELSALVGTGIPHLKTLIRKHLLGVQEPTVEVVTQERQMLSLKQAVQALNQALHSLDLGNPAEVIALDIRLALDALSDIIGETTPDDILDQIFQNFCIGK